MSNVKSNTENAQKQTDTGRRSFMWKVGAGMSAVLAAAVPGYAKTVFSSDKKTGIDDLAKQVAILENEKAIRSLHKQYEDMLDKGMYSEIPGMFTDNAEVVFNGGLFKGDSSIKRLFCNCFASGMTGRKINHAPGIEFKPEQDKIDISPDQKSAKAIFSYSIQVGAPIDSDSTLVKMARLQGEGIRKWWEAGVYEASYVKDAMDKGWKIERLEYKTLAKADYKPGQSYAKSISIPMFSKVYPAEPFGPDRLVKVV